MIFLILVMILWTGALNQTMTYLRIEKTCSDRLDYYRGCTKAASWAISLLETGLPETNPYSCLIRIEDDMTETYVAEFTQTDEMTYRVDVRPAAADDMDLPSVPETFAAEEDQAVPGNGPGHWPRRPRF